MAWYKLHASHGPGHQSSDEEYRWYDGKMDEALKREIWEDWCADLRLDWPIGDMKLVRKLPQEVRERKIEQYRWTMENAKEMLSVLGAKSE